MKKLNVGFTLIELMIVVAIIGILGAIAMPHFSTIRDRARQNKCHEFSALLSRTTELYFIERKVYPDSIDGLAPYLSGQRLPLCPTDGLYDFVVGTGVTDSKKVFCTRHGVASATWGG